MILSKKKIFGIIFLFILSYLPILVLLYFGLIFNHFGLDIRTLLLVLMSFFIKDLGVDIILQMIPFDKIYLEDN